MSDIEIFYTIVAFKQLLRPINVFFTCLHTLKKEFRFTRGVRLHSEAHNAHMHICTYAHMHMALRADSVMEIVKIDLTRYVCYVYDH
jgi:hypothetical protein